MRGLLTLMGSPRRPFLRGALTIGALTLCTVTLLGGYLATILLTGNFHTVIAGKVYRSAQPDVADIDRYAKTYGINTIINLRGENIGKGWYDREVAAARRLDIDHVDFRMSARHQLTQEQAAALIAILASARKPVLIHCTSGADRTGLAAALYLAAVSKDGEAAAERQMSFRYGHISLPVSSSFAMDDSFEALEPWLGFPDS